MGFLSRFLPERRATIITNEGGVATSDPRIRELFGLFGGLGSAAGVTVNEDTALGVPAVWAAVNFIPGTLAGLPLEVFRRKGEERQKVSGPLARLLHDAVNDEMSSFDWRKYTFERVLTGGRAFTYIERDKGQPVNLWPLDPLGVTVRREGQRTTYEFRDASSAPRVYQAFEIIDIAFQLRHDRLNHRGPISANRDVIGLAIAATNYGSRFFENGGVPPFAVTGGFQSPGAMQRAADDLEDAVRKASKEGRQALTLPAGLEIKPIGADPEKSQLVELKRFIIEEIARIYSLPPTFLQDLTHGTFSNTEQQDLHFVKHTLKRWAEQFEQELNLKLFGRSSNVRFAELNMDGLLRGDFKTRMEGNASAIGTGQRTPNEARRRDNLPPLPGGDRLLVQGAMIPLTSAGQQQAEPDPAPSEGDEDE